jgi:hypothetical protein
MTDVTTHTDRNTTSSAVGGWLLTAYLVLLFYGLGVTLLESLLNYPMWWDMGARMNNDDFMTTRRDHTWRILTVMVAPLALRVPVTLALLWRRPSFLPLWAVLIAAAVQLVGWSSSVLIQIPIQFELSDHGFSDALFDRLIVTDRWLRVLPLVGEAAVGVWVLHRAVAAVRPANPRLREATARWSPAEVPDQSASV